MYTIPFLHAQKTRIFFREGAPESGIHHDSLAETKDMSSETLIKIQEFTERIIAHFEENPEKQQAFLNSLDGIKESIFKNPLLFRAFLNRAYEKQALSLEKYTGGERTKKIQEFSTFITDVMLQFANMNNIPRLKSAIDAQKKALEINQENIRQVGANYLTGMGNS